jgi:hypothetical protein
MPWTMGKVTLPATTGTHVAQVPEGGVVMHVVSKVTLDVVYMAPDGGAPEDRSFDVVVLGESLPEYDKKVQRFIGTVDVDGDLVSVFERVG